MFKNIYFVTYGSLRYFLSIIEPGKSNLIVMQDFEPLKQFLSEILPDETLITSKAIESGRISMNSKKRFLQRMLDILICRFQIPEPLKDISPQAKVFFFLEVGLSFFIIFKYLQKKGALFNFVDPGHPIKRKHKIPRSRLPKALQFELWFLELLSGVQLEWFEVPHKKKPTILGLKNHFDPIKVSPMSWSEISRKHNWCFGIDTKNAALFIDCSLQEIQGIDAKCSQQNLVDFCSKLIDKGMTIHIKCHQGFPLNSFFGTALEHKIEILPTYFPVELIMDHYNEVYGIISSSLAYPINGKKFSLAKLLVFNSEEKMEVFKRAYNATCGKDVEMVSPDECPSQLNQRWYATGCFGNET
mgnify:CR=1 FL=1